MLSSTNVSVVNHPTTVFVFLKLKSYGQCTITRVDFAISFVEDFTYQIENKNTKKGNCIDDPMFTMINVISRNEDTQLYGSILPAELTNEDIRNSESYKGSIMLLFQRKDSSRQSKV
ncbi:hypothetical protein Tco_0090020 [Tanacetum coccineum]